MENIGEKFAFHAKVYHYSTSADMVGWTVVSLPKELSVRIRENFQWQEEGWGRLKVTAVLGGSEWQTAIWFDTKQNTYLLPIKAAIRKKEKILPDQQVNITLLL